MPHKVEHIHNRFPEVAGGNRKYIHLRTTFSAEIRKYGSATEAMQEFREIDTSHHGQAALVPNSCNQRIEAAMPRRIQAALVPNNSKERIAKPAAMPRRIQAALVPNNSNERTEQPAPMKRRIQACPDINSIMSLHPLHTPSTGSGSRPTPEYLHHSDRLSAMDAFNLKELSSTKSTSKQYSVTLAGHFLLIECETGAIEVDLKLAEIAACCSSESAKSCSTAQGPFLLAVMPEAKSQPHRFDSKAFKRLTEINDKRLLGIPLNKEEEDTQRPVWIFLVQDNIAQVLDTMSALGAIRIDCSACYHITKDILGKGSFAEVHLARSRAKKFGQDGTLEEGPSLVAKTFHAGRSRPAKCAKEEAAALLGIGPHPNLVSFHGIFRNRSDAGETWTLLLGYCSAGNVLERMRDDGGPFGIRSSKQLAGEMLAALAHVHASGYMHRDVKPENVLLDAKGRFVLADCGAAVRGSTRVCTGTPGYLAPEVLSNKAYNELVDLFSLGAMMHLCICGRRLFPGDSSKEILKSNMRCAIDLNLHACLRLDDNGLDFLDKLLTKDPSKRPSARDALGHRWLTGGSSERSRDDTGLSISEGLKTSMDTRDQDDEDHEKLFCKPNSALYESVKSGGSSIKPKGEKQSMFSSFKGLLRRPGIRPGRTLTKVVPEPPHEEQRHPPGSTHSDVPQRNRLAPGARRSISNRATGLAAWVRGKSQQRKGASSDEDVTARCSPVVPMT